MGKKKSYKMMIYESYDEFIDFCRHSKHVLLNDFSLSHFSKLYSNYIVKKYNIFNVNQTSLQNTIYYYMKNYFYSGNCVWNRGEFPQGRSSHIDVALDRLVGSCKMVLEYKNILENIFSNMYVNNNKLKHNVVFYREDIFPTNFNILFNFVYISKISKIKDDLFNDEFSVQFISLPNGFKNFVFIAENMFHVLNREINFKNIFSCFDKIKCLEKELYFYSDKQYINYLIQNIYNIIKMYMYDEYTILKKCLPFPVGILTFYGLLKMYYAEKYSNDFVIHNLLHLISIDILNKFKNGVIDDFLTSDVFMNRFKYSVAYYDALVKIIDAYCETDKKDLTLLRFYTILFTILKAKNLFNYSAKKYCQERFYINQKTVNIEDMVKLK